MGPLADPLLDLAELAALRQPPEHADLITADGYEIRVESVRENRIEAVRIHAAASGPAPGTGREAGSDSGEDYS